MTRKKLLIVIGVLVLALVALTGLESLAPRKERPKEDVDAGNREPLRPILERPDPRTITLKLDMIDQTRWLYDEDESMEKIDAAYGCLEEGVRREFDDNPTSRRREARRRLKAIREECTRVEMGIPAPPVPPSPGG